MSGENFRERWSEDFEEGHGRAMADFRAKLEERFPEVAREMALVQDKRAAPEEVSWLRESQTELVRNPNMEHYDYSTLRWDGTLSKVRNALHGARNADWNEGEDRDTAMEIMDELYRPILDWAEAAGLRYHAESGPNSYELMNTPERAMMEFRLNLNAAGTSMAWDRDNDTALFIRRAEDYAQDLLAITGEERPPYFEELAARELGHENWKDIALPENMDQAWTVFEHMQGNWSRTHLMQLSEQFTSEAWKPLSGGLDRLKERLDWDSEGPDPRMNQYLSHRVNEALNMAAQGASTGNEALFKKGMENAAIAARESEDYVERGQFPQGRDDGSQSNPIALSQLREAAFRGMEPEKALRHSEENGLERTAPEVVNYLTESRPDLANELTAAANGEMSPDFTSWICEDQTKTVYDSEDESLYHLELDPERTG